MSTISALVKTGLAKSLHKCLFSFKVRVAFKTTNCLKKYFYFKDIILKLCDIVKFTLYSAQAATLPIWVKLWGTWM